MVSCSTWTCCCRAAISVASLAGGGGGAACQRKPREGLEPDLGWSEAAAGSEVIEGEKMWGAKATTGAAKTSGRCKAAAHAAANSSLGAKGRTRQWHIQYKQCNPGKAHHKAPKKIAISALRNLRLI